MSALQPRAERLDLSFPLVFHSEDGSTMGHCLNLSESGLLGTFAEPPELWTTGKVTLKGPEMERTLKARVARVQPGQAGIAFSFANEEERVFVRQLLALAARQTQLVGAPPF